MLNIEKLHPDFGARITGLDLNTDLTPEVLSEIKTAIDDDVIEVAADGSGARTVSGSRSSR